MSGAFFNAITKLCFCVPLDLHTEAVQAALAKYKERKMPMPSKRRSVLVQSSVEACTPPGETSCEPTLHPGQSLSCVHRRTEKLWNTHTVRICISVYTQLRPVLTLGCLHVFPWALECRTLTLCCVQWSKMTLTSICYWKEMWSLMNVSILCDYKGFGSHWGVPRQSFPRVLHNGYNNQIFNIVSKRWPFACYSLYCVKPVHSNLCRFTAFSNFVFSRISRPKKSLFLLSVFHYLSPGNSFILSQ